MEERMINTISLAGTVGIHIIVVLLLLFAYFKPSEVDKNLTEGLEGVPVMLGDVPDAWGQNEPLGQSEGKDSGNDAATEEASFEETARSPYLNEGDKEIVTQNNEETIALKGQDKNAKSEDKLKTDAEEAEKHRMQVEAEHAARKLAEKGQAIDNKLSGLFGKGAGSGSRGETTGNGTQGVTTGNGGSGKLSGAGGWGAFDLGGRSLGSGGLVKPNYSVDDYGTVVVDILVDAKGNVVEATIGKGTNTPNSSLRTEALRAAKKTKFNEVSSVINQKGTITYKFNLN